MVNKISRWGDPWGGGWMDWPAGMLYRLTIAENVTNAFQSAARAEPGNMTDWEKSHPDESKIFHSIIGLRLRMQAENGD